MNDKTKHALKLALDCVSTLANARDWVGCNQNERWDEDEMYAELCNATICLKKSLLIIQEALAEQPAQQQEPVAWMGAHDHTDLYYSKPLQADVIPLYTSPPASKPWVGLTDAERGITAAETWGSVLIAPQSYQAFARAIEAKLKEKNT